MKFLVIMSLVGTNCVMYLILELVFFKILKYGLYTQSQNELNEYPQLIVAIQ